MKEIYVNDPLYQRIKIPEYLVPILDTAKVQRLRSIKQTGLAYLVYPSAIHTRFEHSLGTCFLANMMCEELGLPEREKQLVVLAALLHDVGHVPFGHVAEKYRLFDVRKTGELCLREILQDLGDLLRRIGLKAEEVFSLIVGNHKNEVLNQIIEGPLSADRLDCMLRDSYYTNLPFRISPLTVYNIISGFTVVKEGHRRFICVEEDIIPNIEALLVARQMLFRYVYESKWTRSAHRMLGRALGEALTSSVVKLDIICSIGDDKLLELLSKTPKAEIRRLATWLITRRFYKTILELDFGKVDILTRVRLAAMDSITWIDFENRIARLLHMKEGEILIDLPRLPDASDADLGRVLVVGPKGIYSLQEQSELANMVTRRLSSLYLVVFGANKKKAYDIELICDLFSKPPYKY